MRLFHHLGTIDFLISEEGSALSGIWTPWVPAHCYCCHRNAWESAPREKSKRKQNKHNRGFSLYFWAWGLPCISLKQSCRASLEALSASITVSTSHMVGCVEISLAIPEEKKTVSSCSFRWQFEFWSFSLINLLLFSFKFWSIWPLHSVQVL